MKRFFVVLRLSVGLMGACLCVLFAAQWLGLFPDRERAVTDGRKSLCEALAVHCSLAMQNNDLTSVRAAIAAAVERNPDLTSARLRRKTGKLVAQWGESPAADAATAELDDRSAPVQVEVPILQGKQRWGGLELTFQPVNPPSGWLGLVRDPFLRLVIFVGTLGLAVICFYLRRVLRMLDPAAVVPQHVRDTLDTLAEGVLLLDKNQRIVLANRAFTKTVGRTQEELQGRSAQEIGWTDPQTETAPQEYPWSRAMSDGTLHKGSMLGLDSRHEGRRTLMVNSTCIVDRQGQRRGVLATFDDVTAVEEKNAQLSKMLLVLQDSRDEINRQNKHLQHLASRDPLTGCFNRRAFFEQFETFWANARRYAHPLSCVMVDVDHFKSVNDQHGHAAGDLVLQRVAATLQATVRDGDVVCRYGGEEFCVLLPHLELDGAEKAAERYRIAIKDLVLPNLSVTASLGVSAINLSAASPQELLDQADKSLYFAKRNGRNQVARFDRVPTDMVVETSGVKHPAAQAGREAEIDVPIPFHAVTALTSALTYRDVLTGEHSRRVADLCVLAAAGLMSQRDSYVLEVAAQLHDIGKLGVPDAILLKPGALTADEWEVMGTHDRIGVEIISAAFSCPELTEIVRTHHAWYAGNPRDAGLPRGDDIPLGARILTIADAYDAMVSDRVYRRGRAPEEAFDELRKCSGRQFDPKLVERFIAAISSSDQTRSVPALRISKQSALRIGVQIERLAAALDAQDIPNLAAMAGRLAATAEHEGVSEVASLAADLQRASVEDPDLIRIVALTTDLLQVCRATQRSLVPASEEHALAAV